jgi:hypothetical protein
VTSFLLIEEDSVKYSSSKIFPNIYMYMYILYTCIFYIYIKCNTLSYWKKFIWGKKEGSSFLLSHALMSYGTLFNCSHFRGGKAENDEDYEVTSTKHMASESQNWGSFPVCFTQNQSSFFQLNPPILSLKNILEAGVYFDWCAVHYAITIFPWTWPQCGECSMDGFFILPVFFFFWPY